MIAGNSRYDAYELDQLGRELLQQLVATFGDPSRAPGM